MSDKFTVKELTKEIMDAQPRTIADSIAEVAKKYPERFAPEPDLVEELLKYMCKWCIDYDSQIHLCKADRDCECHTRRAALRTYVADLHDKIESLQKRNN